MRSPIQRSARWIVSITGIAALLAGCGSPWNLRSEIDSLVRLERFGGSLVRVYDNASGADIDDDFQAAVYAQDELRVLGSTVSGGRTTPLVMHTAPSGVISRQQIYTSATHAAFTASDWLTLNALYGTVRWMTAGWYEAGGNSNGLVARLDTITGEPIWIGTVGDSNEGDTIVDLEWDEDSNVYAIGNTTAVQTTGSPIYAKFYNTGDRQQHHAYTVDSSGVSGVDAIATDMVLTDSGELLVVGSVLNAPSGILDPDLSYWDVMIFRINPETGEVIPGSAQALGVTGLRAERAWAVAKLATPERYVIVGSHDSQESIGLAWFVVLLNADYAVEGAVTIKNNNDQDGEARAVIASPEDNYWGRSDAFIITGDNYEVAVLDASEPLDNIVGWASRRSPEASLLNGRANAVVPHSGTYDGLFVVGTNTGTDTDGVVLWSVPEDLSSEPEMVATTAELPTLISILTDFIEVQSITVTRTDVPNPVSSPLSETFFELTDVSLNITTP